MPFVKNPLVAMADALCKEYHLGMLPTELLGIELSPAKAILVNTRILAYRNEQARITAMSESNTSAATGKQLADPADGIRAKRMAMMSQRNKAIREYGFNE